MVKILLGTDRKEGKVPILKELMIYIGKTCNCVTE